MTEPDITLDTTAAQLLDKLADLAVGNIFGTIAATSSVDVYIPQGTMATLPDGRRVRCVKATKVWGGAHPSPVPVRIEWLSPSFPAVGNGAPVDSGTVATWVSPPTGVAATGLASAFASGSQSSGLKINSVVESDRLDTGVDLYAAGANGTTSLVLLEPSLNPIGGGHYYDHEYYDVLWKLRCNFAAIVKTKDKLTSARTVFDRLCKSVLGATAGEDVVRFGKWSRVKTDGVSHSWELEIFTRLAPAGRVEQSANQTDPDIETVGLIAKLPRDADQPSPYRVQEDVTVA